jgi:hypothetical protein
MGSSSTPAVTGSHLVCSAHLASGLPRQTPRVFAKRTLVQDQASYLGAVGADLLV